MPNPQLDLETMQNIHAQLASDVVGTRDAFKKNGRQLYARSYVRSLFALTEADLSIIRYACIVSASGWPGMLTRAEKFFLKERTFFVTDKGVVKPATAKVRSLAMLKFTFNMVVKITKSKRAKPDYDDPGWAAYTMALKIRDRLTHPRKLDDLTVNPNEMQSIAKAHRWFIEQRKRALGALLGNPRALSPGARSDAGVPRKVSRPVRA